MTRLSNLALLTIGIAGSGYFLLRIRSEGWLPVPGGILNAPPEEALYGAVWLLSVSITLWVTLSTVLAVFAYVTGLPAAIRAVEWIAVPPIRRVARRTAAFILAAGSLSITSAAGATGLPPVPFVVNDDQAVYALHETPGEFVAPIPLRVGETILSHRRDPFLHAPPIGIIAPLPLLAAPTTPDRSSYVVYTVQPGDDMWSIATAHLSRHRDKAPSVADIAALWMETIEINRDRIRSGNPDLIFPGEALLVPRLSSDR